VTGTLGLVGGAEFTPACEAIDRALLAAAPTDRVVVLPTAAAFEHPDRVLDRANHWFAGLDASMVGCRVLGRPDALAAEHIDVVRASGFTYLAGGSPMHLRSVLKATPLWDALVAAWRDGGVLAGSSAGAMVLTDPMVDPRGGAFTLGLGLIPRLAVVPEAEQWHHERMHRTLGLAKGFPLVTLATGAALVRCDDGRWVAHGDVGIYVDGGPAALDVLPSVL